MAGFIRLGTATAFDKAVRNIGQRQSELAGLQENLTAGKRVLRASDDPTAAAQAERAITRLARVATDQRALEMQKNSMSAAESTLGDAIDAVQQFRQLLVSAGNSAYSVADRATIAEQLQGLRDQVFAYANRKDTNGMPLFAGLASAQAPFVDNPAGVTFEGIAGQGGSTENAVPIAIDGAAAWMNVPTGNGVFSVARNPANTGTGWSDAGRVVNPAAVTGHAYRVQFSVTGTPAVTTYDVINTTTATPVATAQPYTGGQSIAFDGLQIAVAGTPGNGDRFDTAPSVRSNVFATLDAAIAGVKNAGTNSGNLAHGLAQSLVAVDTGLERLQSARGLAGDLLNRVDRIASDQGNRSVQLEADRARAEDLDMIEGISDFQTQQTGYSAALQSYASIQKLSLFNFIN